MRQWTSGVTIVTSVWKNELHGMTVSSFTSVSISPPLVSVSIARDARTCALIQESGIFGVTILSDAQQEISDRFAGRLGEDVDRFRDIEIFTLTTGAVFLPGGLAWLDCQVIAKLDAGGNVIFIGKVVDTRPGVNGAPLLYFDRNYHNLCE